MDKYFENIDKQIESNKGKNILIEGENTTLKFIDDTVKAILKMNELSADSERILIDYATDKLLDEFCRINQYYSFNSKAKDELRSIYCDLFANIKTNKGS